MTLRNCSTFLAAAVISLAAAAAAAADTVLHHVHGLAFTPDGQSLMVPAHVGLAVYRDGRWTTAPGARHDFMGFSVAKNAIYTSGHPAPGSPLRNPLGLLKSTDGGATWRQLGLSGESDFHQMAASYASGAIYVINAERNSRMAETGLHVTLDEGKTWKHAASSGLTGQIISLAAHPTAPGIVAVGTAEGLYLSRDRGATFKRMGPAIRVTAASFAFDGKHLYYATPTGETLYRVTLDGPMRKAVALPPLQSDFVLYIAQNPSIADELAIATRQRDVYFSQDGGTSWRQIAREGSTGAVAAEARGKPRSR